MNIIQTLPLLTVIAAFALRFFLSTKIDEAQKWA